MVKKEKVVINKLVIFIIIFLTLLVWSFKFYKNLELPVKNSSSPTPADQKTGTLSSTKRQANYQDLIQVGFPSSGEKIGGIINVTGIARGTWYFEGEFPIELVDSAGKILAGAAARAQGEWMKDDFIPFFGAIAYRVDKITEARLIIKRNNPSDIREQDASIEIPVILEPEKNSAAIFFGSQHFDRNVSICNQVFPVARPVSETMASAFQALEELLKGPNKQEKDLDYNTAIPPGVKIKQFDATLPVARVDLSRELLQMDVDVACRRIIIQNQITQTVKGASGAQSVKITVDGRDFPGKFSDEGPEMK